MPLAADVEVRMRIAAKKVPLAAGSPRVGGRSYFAAMDQSGGQRPANPAKRSARWGTWAHSRMRAAAIYQNHTKVRDRAIAGLAGGFVKASQCDPRAPGDRF